jgi:hypothetical protein
MTASRMLVAGARVARFRDGLLRIDSRHPAWHQAHLAGHDCHGAVRLEGGAAALKIYDILW